MRLIPIGDIVEGNGKTIRENNMCIKHNIPIGTLVELKWDKWHHGGACEKIHARLWVVKHARDCDGSPLYNLSYFKSLGPLDFIPPGSVECGFSEEMLKPIEVTKEIKIGEDVLDWTEEEKKV